MELKTSETSVTKITRPLKRNLDICIQIPSQTKLAVCMHNLPFSISFSIGPFPIEHRLEMVQRRAARYVSYMYHNTSSVSDMIIILKQKTIEDRRKQQKPQWCTKLANVMVNVNVKTEDTLILPDRINLT